jgi:pimeloyl-ACP methyl ester carboxylesterase
MMTHSRDRLRAGRSTSGAFAVLTLLLTACTLTFAFASRAHAASVKFAVPAENAMPAPFGSVPFPNDLYFDQGQKGDGDGTLLNNGSSIGFSVVATNANFLPAIERGLDTLTGWGVSTGCHIFFDAAIDASSLPSSPVVIPSTSDSVFLMNLSDGTLVPIKVKADVDNSIPNTLAIMPIPGNVMKPNTTYACVVTKSVTSGGAPVAATADFTAAIDGLGTNTDANDIYENAADAVELYGGGLARSDLAGMAVFTTEDPNADLVAIRTAVLPSLAIPTADFAYVAQDLVFDTPELLDAGLGTLAHDKMSVLATGWYASPRFQTVDPNGNGKTEDLPDLAHLEKPCQIACEPDDERFVDVAPADGLPDVQTTPHIPFTVVVPNTPQPVNGYPIIINQHGLGGNRDTVAQFGNALAERGFASIGIEAVGHGYRFHDPDGTSQTNRTQADKVANFPGGTLVPDGFADQGFFGVPLGAISTQLGFFNAFVNLVGVRDNFRQTCVDLMSLVRLIKSHSIDSALSVSIDENNIFFMGHSLGGLMGSCLAAFEPDVKAYVLNAPGGGLVSELLLNSSIGAGALSSLQTIFGLDKPTVLDDFSIFTNAAQMLVEGGDPITKGGHWIDDPLIGGPRNLMMVLDHQDEVVPNQAGEALAHAAGLELFRPFVSNPVINPVPFPLAASVGTIAANGPGGVTAFLLQQGPAAHAATFFPAVVANRSVSSLGYVPGHAHVDEWGTDGSGAYPSLAHTFNPTQNPSPRENLTVVGGPETATFFDRSVDGVPATDSTPNVVVDFASNSAAGRVTASRSTLGTTALGNASDMPPGLDILGSGVLPFFLSVQKNPQGSFAADVSVSYSSNELAAASIADGSAEEAGLSLVSMGGPGTCANGGNACTDDSDCIAGDVCVQVLSGSVDTGTNTVTASGLSSFSTYALMNLSTFTPALRIAGGGSTKTDCVGEWLLQNPAGFGLLDKKGLVSTKQSCTQGDPACDADDDPSQCTFRVGLCLRVPDPALPDCFLSSVTDSMSVEAYDVRKPSTKDVANPIKPKAAANRAALLSAVNDVLRLPYTATNTCATFEIQVPVAGTKPGKEVIKILTTGALDGKRVKDADKLLLTCNP